MHLEGKNCGTMCGFRQSKARVSGTGRAGIWRTATALALALVACSSADAGPRSTRAQGPGPTVSTVDTLPPETTTSTEATTTTTEAPLKEKVAPAAGSAEVKGLQERLAELGYDVGTPDGNFGARTGYAIMAFQKVEGLGRDGQAGPETQAALAKASRPGPMVPGGAATRIEVDVKRQVLFFWQDGQLARILPVSTGNNERYCVDGECDTAVTPGGSFRVGRKARGLEVGPLGELWWPMYFNRGIAIHGSPSVPAYPASHGCVRIPMYAAPTFYDQIPAGTRVIVVNSPEAEAPPDLAKPVPNATVPVDTVPSTTTPTTAPPRPTTVPTTTPTTSPTTTPTSEPTTTTSSP
jgi:peptidoglycan hydrolase-like protein with peptidoglycan-binding domain